EIADNKSEAAYLLALVIAFQDRYEEAITLLDATLIDYPQDTNLLLAKARVRSYQGLLQEAGDLAERILAEQPQNQEARNLTARIALYQRRPAYAKTLLEEVLASTPNDLEALTGLYDAELALGNNEQASTVLARAASVSPTHIDVLSRQGAAAQPGIPMHTWITGFERSRTDGFSSHWNDRFLEYRHRYNLRTEQSLRVSHNHRFGEHDSSIESSLLLWQQSSTPLELTLGATPDADFSASRSARAAISTRLSEGNDRIGSTVMSASVQGSRYRTGNIARLGLDLEHYLRNIDAWFTLGAGMVRDENKTNIGGWRLGANWQSTSNLRVGVAYSEGAETENGITSDTSSTSGYIAYRLGTSWQMQLNLSQSRRENSYTRDSTALTLQYRY
ncbi:MAG: YaiO family outer membrane beta-barrel protein, partial [Gammaproteobacteria bacterium]|nr:YaiO family outer membrane beta-barrel protein [Gammaproteobacteria bacterium]